MRQILGVNLKDPMVMLEPNYNLVLNSFAYLGSRGDMYSIRKTSAVTKYIPTEEQDRYVRIAITVLPIIILGIGYIVWRNRKRST